MLVASPASPSSALSPLPSGVLNGVSACPLLLWPFCLVPVGPLLPVSADLPLPRVFLPVSLSLIGGITYVCLSCFGMDAVKSR